MTEHAHAAHPTAAGLSALPGAGKAFASTMGAYRFYRNERVTLPILVEPLRQLGRAAVADSVSDYALLIHDWSKIDYADQRARRDLAQLSNGDDFGYELYSALLVDADTGAPCAPMELELRSSAGVHSTRSERLTRRRPHLQQILPTMQAAATWDLGKRPVHVIDREADALYYFREWSKAGELFLVRADDERKVLWGKRRMSLPNLAAAVRRRGGFRAIDEVEIRGRRGTRFVAETEVVLDGKGRVHTPQGRKEFRGPPLTLRLVIAEVRDRKGKRLAQWLLLSNVPATISAVTIATWYYWRWLIETFHKLLKSAGQCVEQWQQETAPAIAKRLLVASMACVSVWQLMRQTTPEAIRIQRTLVRLSGRQTKRNKPITAPALLAGLWVLLAMIDLLESEDIHEIRDLLRQTMPFFVRDG